MTTTEKLREARKRAAAKHAQELAARPPNNSAPPSRRGPPLLLSRDDLREFFGITYSRAHLHRLIRDHHFPAPVALGSAPYARKCWRVADIEAWVAALPTVGGEAA